MDSFKGFRLKDYSTDEPICYKKKKTITTVIIATWR